MFSAMLNIYFPWAGGESIDHFFAKYLFSLLGGEEYVVPLVYFFSHHFLSHWGMSFILCLSNGKVALSSLE